MNKKFGLRDDQWERIEQLVPGKEGDVEVTTKDNRLFVEAVLDRYRAEIPWRDLPERFGDFRVAQIGVSRWSKIAVILPPRNRKQQRAYDTHLYKTHHLINNFFTRLKQYRAIATRYDKLAINFR